uniref:Uncharacterized protein n=1 Tax=Candidatus Kentrum sp. DK TaxID=2126562 RepID=A0A450SDW5_9GAMM|nr:MAG: hypothetical protein BECKDK2373C_GA0170839_10303 [Candidatus Kentron sp. DK]
MKSSVEISRVEATNPPTLTWAPAPNSTPLGLTTNTWPLALSDPRMTDPSEPRTRFRATELAEGWWKVTLLLAPIEKVCQLMAAFWVV